MSRRAPRPPLTREDAGFLRGLRDHGGAPCGVDWVPYMRAVADEAVKQWIAEQIIR
jgi:hypothetical protein